MNDNPYASHENISLLLPWYVNKTLQGTEHKAVEQHLKVCLICKRELVNLHRLSAAVNQPDFFDSAAQASFSRLKNRLHTPAESIQNEVPQIVAASNRQKWYGNLLSRPALGVAAGILLALLLPHFIPVDQYANSDYRTLSNPEAAISNKDEIRVIFKEKTSRQTIDQILGSIQGHIINGPDEQFLFTIGIETPAEQTAVIDKLALLRKNPNVIFAEPAYALLSSTPTEKAKP